MKKNLIDNLNPQGAFKAGLLSGLVLAFVLGFFIYLKFLYFSCPFLPYLVK